VPPPISRLQCFRTQLFDANDMDNAVKVQSGYKVPPLSAFLQQPAPPAPDGPVYMVMRLYWPTDTPPSVLPPGEGTWSPPPVVLVN